MTTTLVSEGNERILHGLTFSDKVDLMSFDYTRRSAELWARNKSHIIEAMQRHSAYNEYEPFKLVFDVEQQRQADAAAPYTLVRELCNSAQLANKADDPDVRKLTELVPLLEGRTLTEQEVMDVKEAFPSIKGVNVGAKTSRIVRKLIIASGFEFKGITDAELTELAEKSENMPLICTEQAFARYADDMNPVSFKRKCVLSVDPADYLLMSHGRSWSSCYAINTSWGSGTYSGCYSSGTLSYMTDKVSMIMYIVDSDITENYADEPKLYREVVMWNGSNEILHSRIYPASDNNTELYKEFRGYAQRIISEMLSVPNDWTVSDNDDENGFYTSDDFQGYNDALQYYMNVVKVSKAKAPVKMQPVSYAVGGMAICPSCGEELDGERYICNYCSEHTYVCEDCGAVLNEDEAIYCAEDGCYYCEDCVTYCDYHQQWERTAGHDFDEVHTANGTMIYCEGAIEDALYEGRIFQCADCGEYFVIDDFGYNTLSDEADELYCDDCYEQELAQIEAEMDETETA